MNPAYRYDAKLVRVVDGDTVILDLNLGFYVTARIAFRLAGIDAPELRAAGMEGEQARDALQEQLTTATKIVVESRKTEKFGRWLATIFIDDRIASVNDWMIERSYARAYDGGAR